jgi:dTDP-glucose 4,6-dehydratase
MKRYLVFGSNSFSGANFVKFLINKNIQTIGISRSSQLKKIYLPYFKSKKIKKFTFYKADINKDIKKIKKIIQKYKPSYIVNYIAQGMVAESWANPEDWYQTNIVSQTNLYKVLSNYRFIKKIIHVTTPEVYGNNNKKLTEKTKFNPSTPYAISRMCLDLHLKKYNEKFKLPIIFTRTANVYGGGQQLYRIVPKAFMCAIENKKFYLDGGGDSLRSFIYIDDASEATFKILKKGKIGDTYHISTNELISIKNLTKSIYKLSGSNFNHNVKISADRIGKDYKYDLSSAKISKKLKWKAKTSLTSGLLKTKKWINLNFKELKYENKNYTHKK